jgi:phosphoribosylformylglycinamidine (FGAM) synthase PurS component
VTLHLTGFENLSSVDNHLTGFQNLSSVMSQKSFKLKLENEKTKIVQLVLLGASFVNAHRVEAQTQLPESQQEAVNEQRLRNTVVPKLEEKEKEQPISIPVQQPVVRKSTSSPIFWGGFGGHHGSIGS